jgi:hypothetical protein
VEFHNPRTRAGVFFSLLNQELLPKNTLLPRTRINPTEKIPQEQKELYGYLSGALVEALRR